MITTNNAEYAGRLRLLRQHGMNVSDTVRHSARQVIIERYVCLGYNGRMTDIQAAMGIEQMKKLDAIVARRNELAARYNSALANHPWLRCPTVPDYATHNFQSYALALARNAPLTRDALMQWLLDREIATRRGVMLSHQEPAYAGQQRRNDLANSEFASGSSLLVPLYPQMTDAVQDQVVAALYDATSPEACTPVVARQAD